MKSKQKILIVDDKFENLEVLKVVLNTLNADLYTIQNGHEALRLCRHHHFSLAILVVQMSGMDGFELAEFLRNDEKTKNIPIIFLTALSTSEENIKKGYSTGAVDYLIKPFNMDLLLSKVKVFLEISSQREELKMHRDSLELLVEERTKKLKESEEFNRRIIESSHDCMKIIDTKGNLLFMNSGGQRLLEIENIEPFYNKSWVNYWKGNDKIEALKAIKNATNGLFGSFQGYRETMKGTPKWWDVSITPITETESEIRRLLVVSRDITEHKKATEDLVKLSSAVEQSPTSIFITDIHGIIEYINPAFTKISGFSPKEAFGKTPNILKSGEQDQDIYKDLWDKILKGEIWIGELVNKHKNGSNYLVQANISPVKNSDNKITHFVAIEEDITEKRKLERKFIDTIVEAQEVEKQSFGEDLHEGISQILLAQTIFIDVLIKLNKDRLDNKAKLLIKVKELNLSAINEAKNIAQGLMAKQLKEVGLIMSIENLCVDLSVDKNISFSFSVNNLNENDISEAVRSNIFRIIQEISTNTVLHSKATKASISLSKNKEGKITLNIKDNGIGMDYEQIKKEPKGKGLKNIERRIRLLNGKSEVITGANIGTCYIITVPLNTVK